MTAADLARTQRTRHPRGVAEIARDNEDKHFLTNGNIRYNYFYLTFFRPDGTETQRIRGYFVEERVSRPSGKQKLFYQGYSMRVRLFGIIRQVYLYTLTIFVVDFQSIGKLVREKEWHLHCT